MLNRFRKPLKIFIELNFVFVINFTEKTFI